MSDVFPDVNMALSQHLLLNLLRWVPLHPGDPITRQAQVSKQQAAPSVQQTQNLETSPIMNCSDLPLPPGAWVHCLS